IRDRNVTGVQTCALPIFKHHFYLLMEIFSCIMGLISLGVTIIAYGLSMDTLEIVGVSSLGVFFPIFISSLVKHYYLIRSRRQVVFIMHDFVIKGFLLGLGAALRGKETLEGKLKELQEVEQT